MPGASAIGGRKLSHQEQQQQWKQLQQRGSKVALGPQVRSSVPRAAQPVGGGVARHSSHSPSPPLSCNATAKIPPAAAEQPAPLPPRGDDFGDVFQYEGAQTHFTDEELQNMDLTLDDPDVFGDLLQPPHKTHGANRAADSSSSEHQRGATTSSEFAETQREMELMKQLEHLQKLVSSLTDSLAVSEKEKSYLLSAQLQQQEQSGGSSQHHIQQQQQQSALVQQLSTAKRRAEELERENEELRDTLDRERASSARVEAHSTEKLAGAHGAQLAAARERIYFEAREDKLMQTLKCRMEQLEHVSKSLALCESRNVQLGLLFEKVIHSPELLTTMANAAAAGSRGAATAAAAAAATPTPATSSVASQPILIQPLRRSNGLVKKPAPKRMRF